MDHQNQLYLAHWKLEKKTHRNVGKLNWLTCQVSWNLGGHRVVWICCHWDVWARWACWWRSAGWHVSWVALQCQESVPSHHDPTTASTKRGPSRHEAIIFFLTVAGPHRLILRKTLSPTTTAASTFPSRQHPTTKLMRFWAALPRYRYRYPIQFVSDR